MLGVAVNPNSAPSCRRSADTSAAGFGSHAWPAIFRQPRERIARGLAPPPRRGCRDAHSRDSPMGGMTDRISVNSGPVIGLSLVRTPPATPLALACCCDRCVLDVSEAADRLGNSGDLHSGRVILPIDRRQDRFQTRLEISDQATLYPAVMAAPKRSKAVPRKRRQRAKILKASRIQRPNRRFSMRPVTELRRAVSGGAK